MPAAHLNRRAFIAGLAAWSAWGHARAATQTPPLLLAQEAPARLDPEGFLVSEKYDGVRAYWDGQVLRFRSGLPIDAPRSFIERLPPVPWTASFGSAAGASRRCRPSCAGGSRMPRYGRR